MVFPNALCFRIFSVISWARDVLFFLKKDFLSSSQNWKHFVVWAATSFVLNPWLTENVQCYLRNYEKISRCQIWRIRRLTDQEYLLHSCLKLVSKSFILFSQLGSMWWIFHFNGSICWNSTCWALFPPQQIHDGEWILGCFFFGLDLSFLFLKKVQLDLKVPNKNASQV